MVGLRLICVLLLTSWHVQDRISFQWSEDRRLEWSDFQGTPESDKGFCAYTHYNVRTESSFFAQDSLSMEVICSFHPSKSWFGAERCKNDWLLAHEQLHFDIGECSARELRMALSVSRPFEGAEKSFRSIGDSILSKWHDIQLEYDAETGHGTDSLSQIRWNRFVDSTLNATKEYSEHEFKVHLTP